MARCRRLAGSSGSLAVAAGAGTTKIVHFVRHGQAAHNALSSAPGAAACACKRKQPGGLDTPQPNCPFNADEAFDAALTTTGRTQAALLQTRPGAVDLPLVVASPLRRALETATIGFSPASVLALESLREQHGMHQCDRRSSTERISELFGDKVLSQVPHLAVNCAHPWPSHSHQLCRRDVVASHAD
jgi:hypothetical protein